MKASVWIIAAAAMTFAAGSFASSTISQPYQRDMATLLLDPTASRNPVHHDSSKDGAAKVRQDRRRCKKDDADCEAGN